MSKPYRTFKKEKWLCFALSIITYFIPLIIVTACLFPMMKNADTGYKVALGVFIVLINGLHFFVGIFKSVLIHFPMLNIFAIGFCILGALFSFQIFAEYMNKFLWIEAVAAVGSVVSCVFWCLYKKYSRYVESIRANVKSGAFKLK